MPGLSPEQELQIREFINVDQLINAIKLYREFTGAGLAEAKSAVEAMARGDFMEPSSEMPQVGNPVLEAKIRSLLARQQKIEAVKIYREEYGVGLKEAKDYVDQIEYSMRRENPSNGVPYEPVISSDPFAEDDGDRRRMIALAVGILILLLGIGAFFLMMNF